MTETPPGRPSAPRTGPAAPAPAHGDGPTRPSTPTGHTGLPHLQGEHMRDPWHANDLMSELIERLEDER